MPKKANRRKMKWYHPKSPKTGYVGSYGVAKKERCLVFTHVTKSGSTKEKIFDSHEQATQLGWYKA